MPKWVCRVLLVGLLASNFRPEIAHAEEPKSHEVAAAQRLYEDARRLMDRKKYAEACPKLEQVAELLPKQPAPHETLGECYKALRRFGSAWEQFIVAQSMAQAKGDPKRAATLAKKAKALESKVAKVKIIVRKEMIGTEGLAISRDGVEQDKALWNTPMPVDTGDHIIVVNAPGREKWSKEITILADGAELSVEVPPLVELKPLPKPKEPPPPVVVVSRRTWQKPLGWTSLTIGGASLVTSAVFSGIAVSKRNASMVDGHCNAQNDCDSIGNPLREQALSLANVATATMIFGGVLAAGGLVVVLTAPRNEDGAAEYKKDAQLHWNVEVSPTGIGLRGVW
jgi:hypothetical protein